MLVDLLPACWQPLCTRAGASSLGTCPNHERGRAAAKLRAVNAWESAYLTSRAAQLALWAVAKACVESLARAFFGCGVAVAPWLETRTFLIRHPQRQLDA